MLTVYGQGASQPVRPILWLCLLKGLPFEFCDVINEHIGREGPIVEMNPTGQIPVIRDDDFILYEMPAILCYLCRKNGWEDLYPSDIETRAYIDQYLHFHHNRTRKISEVLMAPHIWAAFLDIPGFVEKVSKGSAAAVAVLAHAQDPNKLQSGQEAARDVFQIVESGYFRDTLFLCSNAPSIADLACYEEIAQLSWAGLFDLSEFPKITRWLEAMAKLPHHDTVHHYNITLGDIAVEPNTIPRFVSAGAAAVDALEAAGVKITNLNGVGHREMAAMLNG